MHKIIKGYKNNQGIYYDNINDIHYDQKSDLINNVGTFKAETTYSSNPRITSSFKYENGVYIYQSYYDKNTALRIYQNFPDYKYSFRIDDKLVSELQKRQEKIKLTDFPTGIVSIENYIIGQEIPYYENYYTLENIIENRQVKDPILVYLKMLEIFKELDANGIVYEDVHAGNFMINLTNTIIKLIDFESNCVHFDKNAKKKYTDMIYRFKRTIKRINKIYDITFKDDFEKTENLNQIEECVREKQYTLLKK